MPIRRPITLSCCYIWHRDLLISLQVACPCCTACHSTPTEHVSLCLFVLCTFWLLQEMYERRVTAGEILIKEGDTGAAASELFVVKSGEFEVGGHL